MSPHRSSRHISTGRSLARIAQATVIALGLALQSGLAQAEPTIVKTAKAGTSLYEIEFDPATRQLYVAAVGPRGANSAEIVILDPESLEKKGAIELGETPAFGLGLSDKARRLYTANTTRNSVTVIDLAEGKAVAEVKDGNPAHLRQVVIDPDEDRIFVSKMGPREGKGFGGIWVINGKTNALSEIKDLSQGLTGLTRNPLTGNLFATDVRTNEVFEIDPDEGKVLRKFPSGGEGSINVLYDPTGDRLFVANQKSGTVTVLDAKTGDLIKSIATGEGALSLAFDPSRKNLYVANRRAGTVSVVNGDTYEVIANLETGTHPQTIAIDPETGLVYVTNKTARGERGKPPVEDPNGDTVAVIRP